MVHPRNDSKCNMEGHPGLEDLAAKVANWLKETTSESV
jgi:hypothetical protein